MSSAGTLLTRVDKSYREGFTKIFSKMLEMERRGLTNMVFYNRSLDRVTMLLADLNRYSHGHLSEGEIRKKMDAHWMELHKLTIQ